ncbi:hypothetical protein MVEN_01347500 [Mycena venus]|uniref:Uncharacterized protein n=1 Tax=Mycena venus TaxID=2733690 RepID=A0A8H7CU69_9AGAR|nr:hypothetical protein MVEN_01347500 [Mycena venus]
MIPLSVLRPTPRLTSLGLAFRPSSFCLQMRHYAHKARPATWGARVWFRSDGTPRSKVRGLVITSIIFGLLYVTQDRARSQAQSLLARVRCVDDEEYAQVDFSSYCAASDYFDKLCASLSLSVEFYSFPEDAKRREEAHTLVREAAEKVHAILAESDDALDPITANRVVPVLLGAFRRLGKLRHEAMGVEKQCIERTSGPQGCA